MSGVNSPLRHIHSMWQYISLSRNPVYLYE